MGLLGAIIIGIYAWRYRKVPPNKVMFIWGRRVKSHIPNDKGYLIQTGGGRFIWPVFQTCDFLSLEPRTVEIELKRVPATRPDEPYNVDVVSVAQFRIGTMEKQLRKAAENLLGKKDEEIDPLVRLAMEKALRSEIGKLVTSDLLGTRMTLEENVKRAVIKIISQNGLQLDSLFIKELEPSESD